MRNRWFLYLFCTVCEHYLKMLRIFYKHNMKNNLIRTKFSDTYGGLFSQKFCVLQRFANFQKLYQSKHTAPVFAFKLQQLITELCVVVARGSKASYFSLIYLIHTDSLVPLNFRCLENYHEQINISVLSVVYNCSSYTKYP